MMRVGGGGRRRVGRPSADRKLEDWIIERVECGYHGMTWVDRSSGTFLMPWWRVNGKNISPDHQFFHLLLNYEQYKGRRDQDSSYSEMKTRFRSALRQANIKRVDGGSGRGDMIRFQMGEGLRGKIPKPEAAENISEEDIIDIPTPAIIGAAGVDIECDAEAQVNARSMPDSGSPSYNVSLLASQQEDSINPAALQPRPTSSDEELHSSPLPERDDGASGEQEPIVADSVLDILERFDQAKAAVNRTLGIRPWNEVESYQMCPADRYHSAINLGAIQRFQSWMLSCIHYLYLLCVLLYAICDAYGIHLIASIALAAAFALAAFITSRRPAPPATNVISIRIYGHEITTLELSSAPLSSTALHLTTDPNRWLFSSLPDVVCTDLGASVKVVTLDDGQLSPYWHLCRDARERTVVQTILRQMGSLTIWLDDDYSGDVLMTQGGSRDASSVRPAGALYYECSSTGVTRYSQNEPVRLFVNSYAAIFNPFTTSKLSVGVPFKTPPWNNKSFDAVPISILIEHQGIVRILLRPIFAIIRYVLTWWPRLWLMFIITLYYYMPYYTAHEN